MTLRRDMDGLAAELEETGWARDPDRTWTFSTIEVSRRYRRRDGMRIYEK